MPSPIAHSTMGYVIYKLYPNLTKHKNNRLGPLPWLVAAVGLSLLPDFDSVAGILFNDFGRYHNNGSHSLIAGIGVAVTAGGVIWWRSRAGFAYWSGFVFLCYQLHIIMDFFTISRGVMLFWPFSTVRYESPVKLFYGLHWSEGIISHHHFWTLLNELGFALVMVLGIYFFEQKMGRFRTNRMTSSPENLSEQG